MAGTPVWGSPQPGQDWGTPSHVSMGYPPGQGRTGVSPGHVSIGYPPGQDRTGVPPPLSQVRMGYPLPPASSGCGIPPPPSQVRMGYPPARTGIPSSPGTEQQSGHLLRGGRYASCVHAGGLSCFCLSHERRLIKEYFFQICNCCVSIT